MDPHSGPHICQAFPMSQALSSLPTEPQVENRMDWCWKLSPRKELQSNRLCIRGQKHRTPHWHLFPRQKEKEKRIWSGKGCGANSCGDRHGARLEAGNSHSPTYNTCTAYALGKPVRGPSLSWGTPAWSPLKRAAHGLEALPL